MSSIKKNPKRESGRKSESPIGAYLGDVSRYSVLKPEDEKALAVEIAERSVAAWKAVLSYPPFCAAIADVLTEALEADEVEDIPRAELAAYAANSRAYRDRETKANREAFQASQKALAELLADIDRDGKYRDMIAADLEAIDANRRDCVRLAVNFPPKGSRPFARHVQRVRGASQALRYAKNKFVRANLRLVVTVARRFDHGTMPLQDLIQEGNIGLMKAVDRFDHRRGYRFSTYATWWIRHAISRAIANKGRTIRLPAHVSADLQRIGRVTRELEARTGETPSMAELAKASGLSKARVTKLTKLCLDGHVSLDAPIGDDDGRGLLDRLEDESTPAAADLIERESLNLQLYDSLQHLPPIELDILQRRYGLGLGNELDTIEPMTLRQLGERHSLSRERIRQLQERALGKLRRDFSEREIA